MATESSRTYRLLLSFEIFLTRCDFWKKHILLNHTLVKKILSTTSNIKKLICPFFSLFLLLKISPNFLAKNPTFKENAVYENLTVYHVFHKLFAIFPFCVIFFFDEYYHFYHFINLCYFHECTFISILKLNFHFYSPFKFSFANSN